MKRARGRYASLLKKVARFWPRVSTRIPPLGRLLAQHGFLYAGGAGWRLAPAYDLNPVPADLGPRVLATSIDADGATASVELALSVAEYFGVTPPLARRTEGKSASASVSGATSRAWRPSIKKNVASAFGD